MAYSVFSSTPESWPSSPNFASDPLPCSRWKLPSARRRMHEDLDLNESTMVCSRELMKFTFADSLRVVSDGDWANVDATNEVARKVSPTTGVILMSQHSGNSSGLVANEFGIVGEKPSTI